MPLLVLARGAVGADSAAKALSEAGAFTYAGRAGESRGCWMGTWVFVKDHHAYQGLPTNQVMKWEYQVDFQDATGLMVDGPGVDVFAGFGRDHDTKLGAATFSCAIAARENSLSGRARHSAAAARALHCQCSPHVIALRVTK